MLALLRKGETLDDLRRAFMENVAVDAGGCWFWRGRADVYGNFRGKPAHRVSWELHQGPIPDGLHMLHGCDLVGAERAKPGCVNPAHLRPGTQSENARDVIRAQGKSEDDDDVYDEFYVVARHGAREDLRKLARVYGVRTDALFLRAVRECLPDWIEKEKERAALLERCEQANG